MQDIYGILEAGNYCQKERENIQSQIAARIYY